MIKDVIPVAPAGARCMRRELLWRYSIALAKGNSKMLDDFESKTQRLWAAGSYTKKKPVPVSRE